MSDLGAFLRARREALRPSQVGLPSGSRRRTPGLRRSELATMAGLSVEYLARLEQGRDRNPSSQVIGALADALRLSVDDRVQLRRIIKAASGVGCLVVEPPSRTVRPTVRLLLDTLDPAPALVINRLTDVLAWTTGFARLMAGSGLFDRDTVNLVQYALADPRARTAYPNWPLIADARVATLRLALHLTDPHTTALTNALTAEVGAAFTDRVALNPTMTGVEELCHPEAGPLRLAFETLILPDADDQQLIVYLPADPTTADRLAALNAVAALAG